MSWDGLIANAWPHLVAGRQIEVPPGFPHPRWSGFEAPFLAEPVGQSFDWVKSYADGSRIHVHEFSNGKLVVHRDATDPSVSPFHALWHWVTESTSGMVFAVSAAAGTTALLIAKVTKKPKKRTTRGRRPQKRQSHRPRR